MKPFIPCGGGGGGRGCMVPRRPPLDADAAMASPRGFRRGIFFRFGRGWHLTASCHPWNTDCHVPMCPYGTRVFDAAPRLGPETR
jgi:hypothetical protein